MEKDVIVKAAIIGIVIVLAVIIFVLIKLHQLKKAKYKQKEQRYLNHRESYQEPLRQWCANPHMPRAALRELEEQYAMGDVVRREQMTKEHSIETSEEPTDGGNTSDEQDYSEGISVIRPVRDSETGSSSEPKKTVTTHS